MKLSDSLQFIKGVGPKKYNSLQKIGLATIYDFLMYFPRSYEDRRNLTSFADVRPGETVTVLGTVHSVRENYFARRMHVINAVLTDGKDFLQAVWFNQPFLKKLVVPGKKVLITGKADYARGGNGGLQIKQMNSYEFIDGEDLPTLGIFPVYPATEALNQKFLRKLSEAVFAEDFSLDETIPRNILEKFGLMDRKKAVAQIHHPDDFETLDKAHERLVFEELYLIQCGLLLLKKQSKANQTGIHHILSSELVRKVFDGLPFSLTEDQLKVWKTIEADMEKRVPMRRLVQGDVGSGKTVLALMALVKTVENGYQGAFMAPTEILATQHCENFKKMLSGTDIRVGLLIGSLPKKQHDIVQEAIAEHELDIIIGTHALIQDKVKFASLGLVVTDEQHRFGIGQRAALEEKGRLTPDMLVMTATPIPRTMTLTVYGDLDVSTIEHLPPGRQAVSTFVRTKAERKKIYEFVKKEIDTGRQAYVVCPLIESNEEMKLPSVEEVYKELSTGIFKDVRCAYLHGKLPAKEKDAIMQEFYKGEIKLLISTTVIEVGVDVPNASIMVIENADRFGLAQLHQLRGRVGRGGYKSYCVLIAGGKSLVGKERLEIMEKTADGFILAQEDLKLRGPGQFFGAMQHGMGDLRIADVLRDTDVLLKARRAALETLEQKENIAQITKVLSLQYKEQFENILDS